MYSIYRAYVGIYMLAIHVGIAQPICMYSICYTNASYANASNANCYTNASYAKCELCQLPRL